MAGDWIPIETSITTKREVLSISRRLGVSRYEVVGRLIEFWSWVQSETIDGKIVDVSVDALVDAHVVALEFAKCLQAVGWLVVEGKDIRIPNSEKWLTKGAKARLSKGLRQQRWRHRKKNVDVFVDGAASTKTSLQKRREEYIKEPPIVPPLKKTRKKKLTQWPEEFAFSADRGAVAIKHGVPREDVVPTWEQFEAHHKAKGSVFASWEQAWVTWCCNYKRFSGNGNGGGGKTSGTIAAVNKVLEMKGRPPLESPFVPRIEDHLHDD